MNLFSGSLPDIHYSTAGTKRTQCWNAGNKAILMTIAKKSNLFEDVTDSDVASTLLSDYGLDGDIEDSSATHAALVQYDVSDWDFLISRVEAAGLVIVTNEDKIDVVKPVLESTAVATIRFGTNLIEFDAEIDGCQQYGAVKAQAWDPSAQELLEVEANDPGWTTPGNFDAADISTNSGAEEFVLRQPGKLTEEEIQKWADGKLLRSRMAFLCGRARVQGFSKALPAITVAIEGMGDRMNGMVWISGVRHEISQGNWLTDLHSGFHKVHLKPSKINLPGSGCFLQYLHTGVVTALEGDPDSKEG
jgi:phage protein D